MENVEIKQSKIHGQGVFAVRDFRAGEVVLNWKPKIITEQESAELSEEEKELVWRAGGKIFLMHSPERFVNFSCDPNTHSGNNCDTAIRGIIAREEITSDYNGEGLERFKCHCGSDKCNGLVDK
ncbi:MAG: SET domain-containing protein-lysine N-methyltransferase [Candidatus Vogelbacteria bacterium]|nr:SET domain-containing protein-lysine N-methyltransferase [Candidatus Vogelbacteria bacterium]